MSSHDITQRAISHSLTLNNFQGKTKPACPQIRDMREREDVSDRLSIIFQSSILTLCARLIPLTNKGFCDNLSAFCCREVKAALRVMMWTMDNGQGSNPLWGTNAPLTIQVKVTIRPQRGHLTTRTPGSSQWYRKSKEFGRGFFHHTVCLTKS